MFELEITPNTILSSAEIQGSVPALSFVDVTSGDEDWQLYADADSFYIKNTTDSLNALVFDGAGAATLLGSLSQTTGDYTIYENANNSDPYIALGTSAAEHLKIQTVCNTTAKTLNYVLFQTVEAGSTADKGQFKFEVDSTEILRIDDGGLVVTGNVDASTGFTDGTFTCDGSGNFSAVGTFAATGLISTLVGAAEALRLSTNATDYVGFTLDANGGLAIASVDAAAAAANISITADGTFAITSTAFNLSTAGAVSGVTTLAMGGALSGATTIANAGLITNTAGAAEALRLATNADDYTKFTLDANGGLTIESVDAAAAAANIAIIADGTFAVTSTGFNLSGAGAITGVTVNKYTLTQPANGSTLTILDGKTLTVNNSLTLAGTDAQTFTFPTTSDTVACLGTQQTFSQLQTITIPNAGGDVGLIVNQNDTTGNPNAANIVNAGTGYGLFVDQNGAGMGLYMDTESTTTSAIRVDMGALHTGTTTNSLVVIYNSIADGNATSGTLLWMKHDSNAATGKCLNIINDGTGYAADIDQNGNSIALYIDSAATTANGLILLAVNDGTSGTAAARAALRVQNAGAGNIAYFVRSVAGASGEPAIEIIEDHASSTQVAVSIQNDGTGNGIFLDQNENGLALNIDKDCTVNDVRTWAMAIASDNAGTGTALGCGIDMSSFAVDEPLLKVVSDPGNTAGNLTGQFAIDVAGTTYYIYYYTTSTVV